MTDDEYNETPSAWDGYDAAQAERLVPQVDRRIQPLLDRGEHRQIKDNIDTVVENVYATIHGGFGRGDVRRCIYLLLNR